MGAPLVGRTLGHFRVTGEIGAGGMGVVYKADDLRLKRTVALKVLPPELALDPERRARLLAEARAASALNHPHIVTVYEIAEADGTDFIAMEYLEGRSLDRLIGANGLPLTEALAYTAQILSALAAAHTRGVVHRDLKPANVIVTPQRQVKVVDFGLAKRLARGAADSEATTATAAAKTAEGALAGTVAYMSPEQAEGRPVDERSDLFSLGVILYEMATGRRPVHRRHEHLGHLVDRQGHAQVGHRAQPGAAARSRPHHPARAHERPRAAISDREGSAQRSRRAEGVARLGGTADRHDGIRLTARRGRRDRAAQSWPGDRSGDCDPLARRWLRLPVGDA